MNSCVGKERGYITQIALNYDIAMDERELNRNSAGFRTIPLPDVVTDFDIPTDAAVKKFNLKSANFYIITGGKVEIVQAHTCEAELEKTKVQSYFFLICKI